ncbi:MAG: cardiolipin synthase ClsB [Nitrosomonas sp.]|nr:cardiolipin synthase ClsB [Nitrosomonas sp.]
MTLPHFIGGNTVTLLHNGIEYFSALENAINITQQDIYLETYIFANDRVGIRIAAALKGAAQRGVAVHLLIDGFGSYQLPQSTIQDMLNAGVRVLIFRQENLFSKLHKYRLRRMHRKLAVLDAHTAFVGGINIIDDLDNPEKLSPRFDYAVLIKGPLLAEIYTAARYLWKQVAWAHLKKNWISQAKLHQYFKTDGKQQAAFLIRDNFRHRHDIEQAYLNAINHAQHEIIIASAYFLPGNKFCQALNNAAQRGVNIELLLQGRVEYRLQHYATHALYGNLLDAGIKIYEYTKSYLHAKVAVIDKHWATVGSSNIDPFSLFLAREANIIIDDHTFAQKLISSLRLAVIEESEPIARSDWEKESWIKHSIYWASYYTLYYLQSLLGYGQHSNKHQSSGKLNERE